MISRRERNSRTLNCNETYTQYSESIQKFGVKKKTFFPQLKLKRMPTVT